MTQKKILKRYAFAYDSEIGYVEKSIFYPVPFNFVKFLKIVIKYLRAGQEQSAEKVLRKSIAEYCGAVATLQRCNKLYLRDSVFFNYYKDMILQREHYVEQFNANLRKANAALRDQEANARFKARAAQRPVSRSLLHIANRNKY